MLWPVGARVTGFDTNYGNVLIARFPMDYQHHDHQIIALFEYTCDIDRIKAYI